MKFGERGAVFWTSTLIGVGLLLAGAYVYLPMVMHPAGRNNSGGDAWALIYFLAGSAFWTGLSTVVGLALICSNVRTVSVLGAWMLLAFPIAAALFLICAGAVAGMGLLVFGVPLFALNWMTGLGALRK